MTTPDMPGSEQPSEASPPALAIGFTDAQRAGLHERQEDQDRTLAAMHELEASMAAAAPGREESWRESVRSALAVLNGVTAAEVENADAPDSLLSDIARTQPRLRNRVRGVRLQHRRLRETLAGLRAELEEEESGHGVDFGDLRQRVGWAMTSLRHQRARESDLIYEAYYDAFRIDLAAERSGGVDPPA
jgi:hypothetical protein